MSDTPIIELRRSSHTGVDELRASSSPEQLRALAVQFESLLLSQMLHQMRESMFDAGDESGGFDTGPLADTVFTELSVALSRAGGVGLGQSMLAPLMTAQTKIPGIGIPGIGTPGIFRTTSSFGWRDDPIRGGLTFHKGVDLAMPVGQEVPSARPGEVVSAGELPGYGQTVVVRHSDRTSTRYAHLSEILVKPGEIVAAGQTIARSGATGRVTGPHLHFEVVQDGTPVDPEGGW